MKEWAWILRALGKSKIKFALYFVFLFFGNSHGIHTNRHCKSQSDCLLTEYCDLQYSGTCQCRDGYVSGKEGSPCVKGRHAGETCLLDAQCALLNPSLVCFEGRCGCSEGLTLKVDTGGCAMAAVSGMSSLLPVHQGKRTLLSIGGYSGNGETIRSNSRSVILGGALTFFVILSLFFCICVYYYYLRTRLDPDTGSLQRSEDLATAATNFNFDSLRSSGGERGHSVVQESRVSSNMIPNFRSSFDDDRGRPTHRAPSGYFDSEEMDGEANNLNPERRRSDALTGNSGDRSSINDNLTSLRNDTYLSPGSATISSSRRFNEMPRSLMGSRREVPRLCLDPASLSRTPRSCPCIASSRSSTRSVIPMLSSPSSSSGSSGGFVVPRSPCSSAASRFSLGIISGRPSPSTSPRIAREYAVQRSPYSGIATRHRRADDIPRTHIRNSSPVISGESTVHRSPCSSVGSRSNRGNVMATRALPATPGSPYSSISPRGDRVEVLSRRSSPSASLGIDVEYATPRSPYSSIASRSSRRENVGSRTPSPCTNPRIRREYVTPRSPSSTSVTSTNNRRRDFIPRTPSPSTNPRRRREFFSPRSPYQSIAHRGSRRGVTPRRHSSSVSSGSSRGNAISIISSTTETDYHSPIDLEVISMRSLDNSDFESPHSLNQMALASFRNPSASESRRNSHLQQVSNSPRTNTSYVGSFASEGNHEEDEGRLNAPSGSATVESSATDAPPSYSTLSPPSYIEATSQTTSPASSPVRHRRPIRRSSYVLSMNRDDFAPTAPPVESNNNSR